ncbi:MAG: MFS transporter [Bacteroidaceae bacterium]|nr:MFS transporter [Bacteroidaceae bacterium]
MRIYTGKGSITLWALLGIWSVSALTSLPGLAISPILGDLSTIFKTATEFDVQMLTSLPSLLIIPFILLAGRTSDAVGYVRLLYWGLGLFLLSGLLYFLCDSIMELIFVSALLGVGAGIITPLSTSLVSRFFTGEQRTRQFGYSSAVNNLTLVAATAVTGYLAEIEWHLPFIVYLLPAVSLMLVPYIKSAEKSCGVSPVNGNVAVGAGYSSHINYSGLWKLMLYYLFITFLVMAVSVNLPFLMSENGHDSGSVGLVTSLFFLAIMLPGLFLNHILRFLGERVFLFSLLLICCGLLVIFFYASIMGAAVGVLLAGVGYGIAQPCIYDRTASVASLDKVTFALALVMTMNYVAIVISPPVVDILQGVAKVTSERFAFALNSCLCVIGLLFLLVRGALQKRRGNV